MERPCDTCPAPCGARERIERALRIGIEAGEITCSGVLDVHTCMLNIKDEFDELDAPTNRQGQEARFVAKALPSAAWHKPVEDSDTRSARLAAEELGEDPYTGATDPHEQL